MADNPGQYGCDVYAALDKYADTVRRICFLHLRQRADEAENRRMRLERVEWIMWTVLGILEFLLGLRLVINLFSANLDNGFKIFIFGVTKVIIAPFSSLLGMPAFEGSVFEMTTLVAMAAYALIFWIIISLNGSVMARVEQNPQEAVNVVIEPSSSQLPETVLQASIFQDDERQE